MNVTKKSWPLGWIPSDNAINGRSDGLIKMDNLRLDDLGALKMAKGISKVNTTPFAGFVHSIYSRFITSTKHRFVGCSDGTVKVGTGATFSDIITGGNTVLAAFGSAFGQVLTFSGTKKKKYNGTNTYDVTPIAPTVAPVVSNGADNALFWATTSYANFTIDEGVIIDQTTVLEFSTAADRGVVNDYVTTKDFTAFPNSNTALEWDRFELHIRIGNTSKLKLVRVEFLMDTPPSAHFNYYEHEWWMDAGEFTPGINAWSVLRCNRKDFGRHGRGAGMGWANVKGVRIIVETFGVIDSVVIAGNGILFQGGTGAPMHGKYKYMQVNVNDNGTYQSKSIMGPETALIEAVGYPVTITPNTPTDPQVNKIWIYRRSAEASADITDLNEPRKLDTWYKVKEVATPYALFTDDLQDEDALLLDERYDERLSAVKDITDDVLCMAGPTSSGRMLYMTFKTVYISTAFDTGLYIDAQSIKLSGSTTEKNLWITKVSENLIYVGTSEDIYSISGTFAELPDGSMDIYVKGLGTAFPPISYDFAVDAESVFYMSKDGIRGMSGGSTASLNGNLDSLFNGETRHGIAPVQITPRGSISYTLETGKGFLWVSVYNTDATRRLYIYDIRRQYWWAYYTDPISLFYEEDGNMLAGYGGGSGNYLRLIDYGSTIDGSGGQSIEMQTVYDDLSLPRSRKDMYTLKVVASSTGGDGLVIAISKDNGVWQAFGPANFGTYGEVTHDLHIAADLGFKYAVKISGTGLTSCSIYEVSFEFDARPEQQTTAWLPNTNLGTNSRKRFINLPVVIDTLGNAITMTPYIDGVAKTAGTVNLNRKGTHNHYFPSEEIGIDIGALLTGGKFELYGLDWDEIVSEKLPNPATFLVIPPNNYGSPNRKRFSSYKFQINTRGVDVTFTPIVDGVSYATSTINTSVKDTVEYFFTVDTVGYDIGGTLAGTSPFEFYGPVIPQTFEKLPDRLKYLVTPVTNFGVAAKKKYSVIPVIIDTYGLPVQFIPVIDGVTYTHTNLISSGKRTTFHYFTTDIFGVDFQAIIQSTNPFEFYSIEKPEVMEILPAGKMIDQLGPIEFNRAGRVIGMRSRMIATTSQVKYYIHLEGEIVHQGFLTTVANSDLVYEDMRFPPNLIGTVCKVSFEATDIFHRYWTELHANILGDKTQLKVFKL